MFSLSSLLLVAISSGLNAQYQAEFPLYHCCNYSTSNWDLRCPEEFQFDCANPAETCVFRVKESRQPDGSVLTSSHLSRCENPFEDTTKCYRVADGQYDCYCGSQQNRFSTGCNSSSFEAVINGDQFCPVPNVDEAKCPLLVDKYPCAYGADVKDEEITGEFELINGCHPDLSFPDKVMGVECRPFGHQIVCFCQGIDCTLGRVKQTAKVQLNKIQLQGNSKTTDGRRIYQPYRIAPHLTFKTSISSEWPYCSTINCRSLIVALLFSFSKFDE